MKFGRLLATKICRRNDFICWLCICDCGNKKIVSKYSLLSGFTKSCGCLNKEKITKHGFTIGRKSPPIYSAWCSMKGRCLNPTDVNYFRYGGRGITVCKRWLKFESFLADMGKKPKGMTLERIDNNRGYYKKNCRWATVQDQSNNRRTNIKIFINGEYLNACKVAEKYKIPRHRIYSRLKYGFVGNDLIKLSKLQMRLKNRKIPLFHFANVNELAKYFDISHAGLYWRINNGWKINNKCQLVKI